ncbi:hypothetical protein QJS66_21645 [Kocuria rhizophila]|nr:hypothetical protein QJS66_21645 [Kocuria rhizophila]
MATYTAMLLRTRPCPRGAEMHGHLAFVFASSASLASGGLAMLTTPVDGQGPPAFRGRGRCRELVTMRVIEEHHGPRGRGAPRQGRPGQWLEWSERLSIVGGLGALLGGRRRSRSPRPAGLALSSRPRPSPLRRVWGGGVREGPPSTR